MELQLLEIKSPQQQMEVGKNEKRGGVRRRGGGGGGEGGGRRGKKQGGTGVRQRWQAVKVAVAL